MFNLGSIVATVADTTITVKRPAADTYDGNGVAVARTFTTIATNRPASCQPLKGAALDKLPEGELVDDWQTLFTAVPLKTGDYVTVAGKGEFQVRTLGDWQGAGAFSKVFIRKMGPGEPRA